MCRLATQCPRCCTGRRQGIGQEHLCQHLLRRMKPSLCTFGFEATTIDCPRMDCSPGQLMAPCTGATETRSVSTLNIALPVNDLPVFAFVAVVGGPGHRFCRPIVPAPESGGADMSTSQALFLLTDMEFVLSINKSADSDEPASHYKCRCTV